MKSTNSKKASLPVIKTPGRKSVQFAASVRVSPAGSEKSGRLLPAIKNGNSNGNGGNSTGSKSPTKSVEGMTVHFVYSQAVERAFRRCFYTTDFGPLSAKPTLPFIDITELPEMYLDWLTVKECSAKKQEYIKRYREEEGIESPKNLKYGYLKHYHKKALSNLNAESRRGSGMSQPRLSQVDMMPPLTQVGTLSRKGSTRSQVGIGVLSRQNSFNRMLPSIGSGRDSFNRRPSALTSSQGTHSRLTVGLTSSQDTHSVMSLSTVES